MLEIIVSVSVGVFLVMLGIAIGAGLTMYAFRKGVKLTDNVYHDKAPFDEALQSIEPLDSHTDGKYLDEEE
jgi:hypothetical protein